MSVSQDLYVTGSRVLAVGPQDWAEFDAVGPVVGLPGAAVMVSVGLLVVLQK